MLCKTMLTVKKTVLSNPMQWAVSDATSRQNGGEGNNMKPQVKNKCVPAPSRPEGGQRYHSS